MRRTATCLFALALLAASACGDDESDAGAKAGAAGSSAGSAGSGGSTGGTGAVEAGSDAPPTGVVVHGVNTFVTENGNDARPIDFSQFDVGALVRDPASNTFKSYPPTITGPGTLAVPGLPPGEYYFRIAYLGVRPRYVVTSATELDVGRFRIGRPDVQPAQPSTSLIFDLTGLAPWQQWDTLEFHSLGAAAELHYLASEASTGAPAVGATQLDGMTLDFANVPDPIQLIDGSKGDRLWITQVNVRNSGAYWSLAKAVELPSFTQSDGQATTLSGSFADVPQSSLSADFKLSQFDQALLAANPGGTIDSDQLILIAQPESSRGSLGMAPYLIYVEAFQNDLSGSFDYGNPFPASYGLILEGRSNLSRTYTIDGKTIKGRASMLGRIAPTGSLTLAPIVGPVENPTIGGKDARVDQTGVGENPTLGWSPPTLGTPTLYVVDIYRFNFSSTGSVAQEPVCAISTTGTEVVVPPGIMSTGNRYAFVISALSRQGVDGARQPFSSALPEGEAEVLSGVITP